MFISWKFGTILFCILVKVVLYNEPYRIGFLDEIHKAIKVLLQVNETPDCTCSQCTQVGN